MATPRRILCESGQSVFATRSHSVHVVPSDRHWLIKLLGSTVETQYSAEAAIAAARVYVNTRLWGELLIDGADTSRPTIETIRRGRSGCRLRR